MDIERLTEIISSRTELILNSHFILKYYFMLGEQRYTDLGLGTHRVKCMVHPDFK